ncbi:HvfB family MNIO-type RiPP peptide maturase [Stenotrophomonas sp. P5_B8]
MPSTDPIAPGMHRSPLPAAATGLGLRRALLQTLRDAPAGDLDFLECAPENWIGVGGPAGEALADLAQRYPLSCHGLSLSLGSTAPLDTRLLAQVGRFLDQHRVPLYSEHLSYCSDDGHLYDLLPIPFTDEAVHHTAARIARVQDVLGRRIAVENVSYYLAPEPAMDELAFTNAVLAEANCDLLLDVNNVYVNACNHGYDADAFIAGLPAERIVCLHVAGHLDEAADLKIDTHGSAVIDPVWDLLARTYARIGARPTLLERDFNFPPYPELRDELRTIRQLMAAHAGAHHE